MPDWLLLTLGVVFGLALISLAVATAFLPELWRSRRSRPARRSSVENDPDTTVTVPNTGQSSD
ncbi:hypothetical protein [Methylobrevis albus]|uniref:Uncharacterized protein n=1 Tax=Methylobrevis albus TaxID=2793297 RepID=A0A931MWX3_9HYPH|nr:hypothetical protein [Methylobrevis albus]MBH0238073.1 hypothetical protein [Methylobrevis albus]